MKKIESEFYLEQDGTWAAKFHPEQILLSEFLEGDLYTKDACDSLEKVIKELDIVGWGGDIGSITFETETVVLESLWRDNYPLAKYNKTLFLEIIDKWRSFLIKNNLP